jgi:hypothetical protein
MRKFKPQIHSTERVLFLKRIGIALFNYRPAFRGAWHLAPIRAISSSSESFINFLLTYIHQ